MCRTFFLVWIPVFIKCCFLGVRRKPRHAMEDVAFHEKSRGETQTTVIREFLSVKIILFLSN